MNCLTVTLWCITLQAFPLSKDSSNSSSCLIRITLLHLTPTSPSTCLQLISTHHPFATHPPSPCTHSSHISYPLWPSDPHLFHDLQFHPLIYTHLSLTRLSLSSLTSLSCSFHDPHFIKLWVGLLIESSTTHTSFPTSEFICTACGVQFNTICFPHFPILWILYYVFFVTLFN